MKLKPIMLFWMGIVLIVIGIIGLIPLYFIQIPPGNSEMLSMTLGVVLGWGSMAVAYYFGQSETSNHDKQ